MSKLRHCVIGKTQSQLIEIISSQCDRYGDKLLEFMDMYKLTCLQEATTEQLGEYISQCLCPQNEKGVEK